MDPAPRSFDELLTDPGLEVPVPFACQGDRPGEGSVRTLERRRVIQCALSRVCGVCGASLGRPIAFLGTPEELARNAFHFPPSHLDCAQALLAAYDGLRQAVLDQPEPVPEWALVTTAAFEFVRPGRGDLDRRPVFQASALLTSTH